MPNKWMHCLKGYVEVRLEGDYPERLFNMCRSHGIELWDIRQKDNEVICNMSCVDFVHMPPLTRKTGTKVKVLQKTGLPFYIFFLKKRLIFFIGVALCLFMLNMMTRYVWAIEYVGNMQISDDELTDFLEAEGIRYGMRKELLDCEAEEKQLREAFPLITWTSVYFEGTKLYVEIKENEKRTQPQLSTGGMDIVATQAGTITSIITRNGIPKVKAGDTVEAGQLLVAGAVPVYDESQSIVDYQLYEADADIRLSTVESYHASQNELYPVIVYTQQAVSGVFIEFAGIRLESLLPVKSDRTYEVIQEKKQFVLLENMYLPVFYGTVTKKEYCIQYRNYTKEELSRLLMDGFDKFILCLQQKGVQIIEKDVKMVKNRKGMEINADLLVVKPTGEKTAIRQENGQEE